MRGVMSSDKSETVRAGMPIAYTDKCKRQEPSAHGRERSQHHSDEVKQKPKRKRDEGGGRNGSQLPRSRDSASARKQSECCVDPKIKGAYIPDHIPKKKRRRNGEKTPKPKTVSRACEKREEGESHAHVTFASRKPSPVSSERSHL